MAQDFIAVLDGIMPNQNTGNGYAGSQINPSGSAGANYSGGSSFYPGAPTMPSSEGLAGMEEGWMNDPTPQTQPQDEYAGYLAAFSASPYVVTGDAGDGDAAAMTGYQGRSFDSSAGYVGSQINPSGSAGANYSGGSSFYPGAPTYPSSEGLAGVLARATLHGFLSLGISPMRAAAAIRAARPAFTINVNNPCGSAFDAAYKSAIAAGYDQYHAQSVATRCAERCMAIGFQLYSTKA